MCFSAEASFTAAAVLGGIGLLTCKGAKAKHLLLLSMTPFIFAMQQFSEGMVWLTFKVAAPDHNLVLLSKSLYLFFAFILWPLWFPVSLAIAEQVKWRKNILLAFALCSIILSLYFLSYMPSNEIIITIVNHSIQYGLATPFLIDPWILLGIYTILVIMPLFISSLKLINGLGIFNLIAWLITEYFRQDTFISTWCFFSAFISIYIFFVIRANNLEKQFE